MDATDESGLLDKLESSNDLVGIYNHFDEYLQQFKPYLEPKMSSSKTSKVLDLTTLAEKFVPFLKESLFVLFERISSEAHLPLPYRISNEIVTELLCIYRLCLRCLGMIDSELPGMPGYRSQYILCLMKLKLYEQAKDESFSLLKSLTEKTDAGKVGEGKTSLLVPKLNKENRHRDFAVLIVEIVLRLVTCVSKIGSKEEAEYDRIMKLVCEAEPWFKILDGSDTIKWKMLVRLLYDLSHFMIKGLASFNKTLVINFFKLSLSKIKESSIKDQMYKFALKACCCIFLEKNSISSSTIDVLEYFITSIKVKDKNTVLEFLKFICDYANYCRTATSSTVCCVVGELLGKLADSQVIFPIGPIMRLHATGLLFSSLNEKLQNGESATDMHTEDASECKIFGDFGSLAQQIHVSLYSLKDFYAIGGKGNGLSEKGAASLPYYYKALAFLCVPIATFIRTKMKEILCEKVTQTFISSLVLIQEALCEFGHFHYHSVDEKRNLPIKIQFRGSPMCIIYAAVANCTAALKTGCYIEESSNVLNTLISNDGAQVNGLLYLSNTLYNLGIVLYQNKKMKEASEVLKLSCKASWNHLVCHCKSNESHGDAKTSVSSNFTNAAKDFIRMSCDRTIFLLEILYKGSSHEISTVVKDSLEKWSIAENMAKSLPPPYLLVKHWVKRAYMLLQDGSVLTLYSLLSSVNMSMRTLGILLEQELTAYTTVNSLNLEVGQKMRREIIDTLLEKVYSSSDNYLNKSRILIAKGKELRASGVENLEECIQYLTKAIYTLGEVCYENTNCSSLAHHLMASAHCLRALCSHERLPLNSKKSFEDIQNAVKLWLCHGSQSTTMLESMLELLHDDDWSNIMVKEMLKLVYDVLDFLSIKGYTKIQPQIFDILIRLFKWMKLPVEKVLTMLWGSRKLSHFLCASPIHEIFQSKLSEHYGEFCNCSRFWMKCMELSKPHLVGFQLSFLSSLAEDTVKPVGSDLVSVDEVKSVASNLISIVQASDASIFLSAYLYYDLSEQLVQKGQVVQALRLAEKSHMLRHQLFGKTFEYCVKMETKCNLEFEDCAMKYCYAIDSFHLHKQVTFGAWGLDLSHDFEYGIITPWAVLQCYLESILQLGTIQEILGNGIEAEKFLSHGKAFALHQCLPLYVVCFSNLLGKQYSKRMLWGSAEKELNYSSEMLNKNMEIISCLKCRTFLQISISQQLGDLFKIRSSGSTRNPSMEMLSRAGEMYLLALCRLHLSEWKNPLSSYEDDMTNQTNRSYFFKCKMDQSNSEEIPFEIEKSNVKGKPKGCRMKKEVPSTNSLRMTRSRTCALGINCGTSSGSAETCSTANSSIIECTYEVARLCNKMTCWHCLALQVIKTLSLDALVHMKWELIWRRLSLVLFVSIGKCLTVLNENHKAHHILLLSTSTLRNPFCENCASHPLNSVVDLMGKGILVDVLAIEQALLLYHICQVALESYSCNFIRETSCLFSRIGIPKIVSWLKLAFLHCSEVPLLFQKVSRLLTVLHVLSTSVTSFSLSSETDLSESHWAGFFHQASIGNTVDQLLFSCLMQEGKWKDTRRHEGTYLSCSDFISSSIHHSLRAADKSRVLDEIVSRFYQRLPSSTVLCISMFQGSDAYLLSDLLSCPAQGWILLCRLNSSNQPVLVLLPNNSVLDESSVGRVRSNTSILYHGEDPVNHWHCPWLSTVIDEVAPIFKVIQKEIYKLGALPREVKIQNFRLWHSERLKLDQLFGEFLQGLEDSWLGPWKYLLLGHLPDNSHVSSLERKLENELMLKCEVTVSKDILRVILIGAIYASEIRTHGLQLILNKGCFIGGSCKDLSNTSSNDKSLSMDVFQMVLEGEPTVEDIKQLIKKPVILVLDSDIQMLPWESLSILRSEEVYRMPSVAWICATLQKLDDRQELHGRGADVFPLIDPLDCFYLLNPGGDLFRIQNYIENWFRDQNFEGKAGAAPRVEELVAALKNHDLFMYIGHGSGCSYIPNYEIAKIEGCAAAILIGCSSGCLSSNGSYPCGAPLAYLLGGSPVIIANLWDVTDKDACEIGKNLADAWLKERSNSTRCSECDIVLDEFERKKKRLKSKRHASNVNDCTNCCNHRPKVGFFMGQARKACHLLPFFIGAAPVCYGVPTGIAKKKKISKRSKYK